MKRKARKSAASLILNRVIGLSLTLLILMGAISVGVVKLRHETSKSANRIKMMEEQIGAQQRQLAALRIRLSRSTSQDYLLNKNEAFALGLMKPGASQIVRVSEEQVESRLLRKTPQGSLTAFNDRDD